jgi:hypothetical protein
VQQPHGDAEEFEEPGGGDAVVLQRGDPAARAGDADHLADHLAGVADVQEHGRCPAGPETGVLVRQVRRIARVEGNAQVDQDTTMLDHPDRHTTRIIVQTFADATANGWAGRQLPRLFRQAGLTDLSVRPVVNLGEAAMFHAMLRPHVDRLCADNVLTAAQAGDWWHALEQQAADGHFLAGAVIFVVAATRPDGRTG